MQSQKAVSACFTSEQLLHIGFAEQYRPRCHRLQHHLPFSNYNSHKTERSLQRVLPLYSTRLPIYNQYMTAFLSPKNVKQSPRIGLTLCRRLRGRHNVKPIQGEHTTYLVRRSDHCPLTWPPHWPIAAGAARTGWAVAGQQWASPGSDWSVRGWPPRGCGRRADVWAWRHAAGGLGEGEAADHASVPLPPPGRPSHSLAGLVLLRPRKYKTLIQCCFSVGPPPSTAAQH